MHTWCLSLDLGNVDFLFTCQPYLDGAESLHIAHCHTLFVFNLHKFRLCNVNITVFLFMSDNENIV